MLGLSLGVGRTTPTRRTRAQTAHKVISVRDDKEPKRVIDLNVIDNLACCSDVIDTQ